MKTLLIAPPASGKTTAERELGTIDIDFAAYRCNERKERDPNFPVNFVGDLVKALENYPVVTTNPMFVTDLIEIINNKKNDRETIRDITQYVTNAVLVAERKSKQFKPGRGDVEFDALTPEIDNLAERLVPLLKQLKKIDFEPVLVIPADEEAREGYVTRDIKRMADPHEMEERRPKGTPEQGRAKFNQIFDAMENVYKETGLFAKALQCKDQMLPDVIKNLDNQIERPAASVPAQIQRDDAKDGTE